MFSQSGQQWNLLYPMNGMFTLSCVLKVMTLYSYIPYAAWRRSMTSFSILQDSVSINAEMSLRKYNARFGIWGLSCFQGKPKCRNKVYKYADKRNILYIIIWLH